MKYVKKHLNEFFENYTLPLKPQTNQRSKEMKKILVIENSIGHIEDAKKFFESKSNVNVEVIYTKTFKEAKEHLPNDYTKYTKKERGIDGVISEILFSHINDNGYSAVCCSDGAEIMKICLKYEVPFVLNTAGFHRNYKYEWFRHMTCCSALSCSIIDTEWWYQKKKWGEAYENLMHIIARQAIYG